MILPIFGGISVNESCLIEQILGNWELRKKSGTFSVPRPSAKQIEEYDDPYGGDN